ncbi:acetyl-CoA hydrolase/transferase [delta proteobacterium NaphS2]|nr:acetyl-CoA hydrolase/transferase [delta proteobacterium NaphS2]
MGLGSKPRKGKVSADDAIAMIHSGQRLALSPVCAEPQSLVRSLINAKNRLNDVLIYTMLPMGECAYARPEMERHFKIKTFSVGPGLMEAVNNGRAEYVPCHLSQIPGFFSSGLFEVDVALVQLSSPDRHGYCSLGVSVSYIRAVLENAKIVIAQINEQMPRTLGDSLVHLSQVDYVVESSDPLPAIPRPKIGDAERKIGAFTSELIPDGSVIQVGLGNMAAAILEQLKNKRNLSIHTGTFSDGVMDLVESGAIDAAKGRGGIEGMVATELIGSAEFYEFCHENHLVSLRPITHTHNIKVLGKIDNFISVTAAIEIDLTGQINAEMRGETLMNGLGGQLDFLRGAAASSGGKAVVAFPSTAKRGTISRIVSKLNRGTSVTVGRADVDYVITEYGVAKLCGKSLRERAKALIGVAHPDFREDLKNNLKKSNI